MKPLRSRAPMVPASPAVLVPRAATPPIKGMVMLPAASTM